MPKYFLNVEESLRRSAAEVPASSSINDMSKNRRRIRDRKNVLVQYIIVKGTPPYVSKQIQIKVLKNLTCSLIGEEFK